MLLAGPLSSMFPVLFSPCYFIFELLCFVPCDLWLMSCTFTFSGPHQAGDALLAAAAPAETLGIQQHERCGSKRQLELPDLGIPPHRPCGPRQWYADAHTCMHTRVQYCAICTVIFTDPHTSYKQPHLCGGLIITLDELICWQVSSFPQSENGWGGVENMGQTSNKRNTIF